jgi:hypothetical protein
LQRLTGQVTLHAAIVGQLQLVERNGDALFTYAKEPADVDDGELLLVSELATCD